MRIILLAIVGITAMACACYADRPNNSQATPKMTEMSRESRENLKYGLLKSLMLNASSSLKGRKYCDSFVTNGQDTIGKFISWNLSFYEENQSNSVSATCEKANASFESCTVNFYADSKGESPWACGLRFKHEPKTKKIDFQSVECVGTC